LVSLLTLAFSQMSSAFAAGSYPPAVQGSSSSVAGVKVGDSGLSGGLAATGFDATMLWAGIAVLLLGVVLVAVTRHRSTSR